jgi:EAL domain-containing protein (putative c-di-GMP-specific phosphodiesterase class I)
MAKPKQKSFNLPYLQHDSYWLSLFAASGLLSPDVSDKLQSIGYKRGVDGRWVIQTPSTWAELWGVTYAILEKAKLADAMEASLTADSDLPTPESGERKKIVAIQVIAENLWLGEALRDDRMMCYFQPIIGEKQKIFGFESFVRVRDLDGKIIGGDKIIKASQALNIEHMIDRHLHVQAVQTFADSNCSGFLFVNFFPGFIHRPAVYLEGLSEAAKMFGIVPKHLVLEFTRCETARDMKHLKNVCDYARLQGYSIALDDITTVESAKKLVAEIRPDFVKIDSQHLGKLDAVPTRNAIRQIVDLVHAIGSTIIAEGVETEEAYEQLKALGVDLFQGYYFSPPAPISKI